MLKKIIGKYAVALAAVCVATLFASFSVSAATVYGDANADSRVDIKDLVRVKKYLADENTPINLEAVDDDENGKIESSDLIKLRKVLLGVETYELSSVEGNISWPEAWDNN